MLTNRVGWETFEPREEILKACKATKGDKSEHGAERVWLHATTNTLPHMARLVLKFIDEGKKPGLHNKRTKSDIRLDTRDFSLASQFRLSVETLASGPLAEKLENSPHMGMAEARSLLNKELDVKTRLLVYTTPLGPCL